MGEPEAYLYAAGYRTLMGVDEVGRGPLAGSVVAAAVILPHPLPAPLHRLNDSKKLSETVRNELFSAIVDLATSYGVGEVSPAQIDEINILQATFLAMRHAIEECSQRTQQVSDLLLVDGKHTIPGIELPQTALIKGDGRSHAIAAASIIAKVTRDRQMMRADEAFPQYGFAQHKGYGTKQHRKALMAHGPCTLHRRSFAWKKVES